MDRQEFNNKLKEIGLTKKELSEIVGISYSSVNNWGTGAPFPRWLDSWLDMKIELFICANKIEELESYKRMIESRHEICCNELDQLKKEIEECRKIKDYEDLKKFAKIKDFIENSGICEDKED